MGHDDELAGIARAILSNRQSRSRMFPSNLFGEWAWEVLLLLFVADAEGQHMTGKRIADALKCNPSLIVRWIKHLSSVALVIDNDCDNLDVSITLSPPAITALERYLADTVSAARLMRL
jgi:hypothetical protein